MAKRIKGNIKDDDLYMVLSIAEAAAIWHVSTSTVRYHIDAGNLPARKCGHTIIVPAIGMIALYGPPRRAIRG